MKKIVTKLGVVIFWLTWPATYLYVRTSQRSRILVVADKKILVCKSWHGTGKWSLPGGGIHKHESAIEGVRRELKEETGLKLDASQIIYLGESIYNNHGLRFLCHYFVAEIDEQLLIRSRFPEILETMWINPKTLNVKNSEPDLLTTIGIWSTP